MKQTDSYKFFKKRIQEIFSFAVLVTASVPNLKETIDLFESWKINRLPDPGYFKPSVLYEITDGSLLKLKETWDISDAHMELLSTIKGKSFSNNDFKRKITSIVWDPTYKKHRTIFKRQTLRYTRNLKEISSGYKKNLSAYLYFSCFAFFESFVIDILKEITKSLSFLETSNYIPYKGDINWLISDYVVLDTDSDSRKIDRYKKYSESMRLKGYKTPEELLSSRLLESFNKNISDLKSADIPKFLEENLFYKMTEQERQTFHSVRNNRNSIWHGLSTFHPDLEDVVKINKFFKELGKNIDNHVSLYFIRPRNYR